MKRLPYVNKIKNSIIHTFIFAIYPVFHLYVLNRLNYSFSVVILPTVVIVVLTIVILFLLTKYLKDLNKAAILLMVFWIWFFLYDGFRSSLINTVNLGLYGRHKYLIPAWILVILPSLLLVYFLKIDFKRFNKYFNITGFFLIIFLLVQLSISLASEKKIGKLHFATQSQTGTKIQPTSQNKNSLPNIYFIILDAYSGDEALKKNIGYDNSDFIRYLERKGFYVAQKSKSNYSWTLLSIASTLNLDYLPIQPDDKNPSSYRLKQGVNLYDLIANNTVIKYLASLGYKYIDLSIWDGLSILSDYPALPGTFYRYDFWFSVIQKTILGKPLVENYLMANVKRNSVLTKFERLKETVEIKEPFFVYAHFMIPHHAYVFDKDGKRPPLIDQTFQFDEKSLYINQLRYVNLRAKEVIDFITEKSQRPPIIIIQGDHGAPELTTNHEKNIELRMSILNALFLPDMTKKKIAPYDSISSVNTFRMIFDNYFNTDWALLKDTSYYQDKYDRPLIPVSKD